LAINAPKADQINALEDIAILTGGRVFSEKKGDKLESVTLDDLGRADRIISKRTETVIIGPRGKKAEINKAKSSIMTAINMEPNEGTKKNLKLRLSRFTGKVGVIKVGAPTENEVKALHYKAEDAVNATHEAFKGGVVAGGGAALAKIKTSSDILNAALQAPFRQLKINCGITEHKEIKKNEAMNVITGETGDWQKIGIMDPVGVLIAQLESAISIASLLASVSGLIVEKPKHIKEE